ncbi:putative zinc finger MYM-type protein 1-like [Apostichopus japonicus]|uniref:Putative zinc finger MYM-type protein 1-like n=1 Tax=Stichopus japonicus TaxID=307972 RepID=A0A2G8KFN7_STIJA|nr:putative zinc finger MYM-type protein 1-like [Apostichopus japonicus]
MYFGFSVAKEVFCAGEQVSSTLQSSAIDFQTAITAVSIYKRYLQNLRSEEAFDNLFERCVTESEKFNCSPPSMPRRRRPPRRIDGDTEPTRWNTAQEYYRYQVYQVLDCCMMALDERLNAETLSKLMKTEELMMTAANGQVVREDILQAVQDAFKKDLDTSRLASEIKLFGAAKEAYNAATGENMKRVSSMTTIRSFFTGIPGGMQLFSELAKLLMLYLTVPLTLCTAERSFSSLRRLKTYMRSTMTQQRLNDLTILHVHKKIAQQLDERIIARKFINDVDRRECYFGNVKV